jgi:TolB-like protein
VHTKDNLLHVSAELIDVASQGHLWSDDFDRELRGVETLPSEIATQLAHSLKVRVPIAEKRRAELR